MPLRRPTAFAFGNPVEALGVRPEVAVGPALMGRVLNALGLPIDEGRLPSTPFLCRWTAKFALRSIGCLIARRSAPDFVFWTPC